MLRSTKRGKCERCCPDGGAIFRATTNTKLEPIWKCNNCHLELPRRSNKRTSDRLTPKQQKVVDRIKELFGSEPTIEFIGRKAFVSCKNETRPWYKGTSLFGVIGATGKFEVTLQKLGGDVKITTWPGLTTYLE